MLMFRLTEHEFGEQVAQRTIFYLVAFPMGFYLFAGYNESLYLACVTGALYCARKGNWWLAGACGALASSSRLFGVALLVPLGVEYLRQRDWRPWRSRADVFALGLVPGGLVAYALYCWHAVGDPLAFNHAQQNWNRSYTIPGAVLWTAARQINDHGPLDPNGTRTVLELAIMLFALVLLALCVVGPWKLRHDQLYLLAFAGVSMLLLISTEVGSGRALQSAPRYVLEVLPLFMVLGRAGKRQLIDKAYLMTGLVVQTALLVAYLEGSFVA